MKNKIKTVSLVLALVVLLPQIALASWWNPLTWKMFQKKVVTTEQAVSIPVSEENTQQSISQNESKLNKYLESLPSETEEKNSTETKTNPWVSKADTSGIQKNIQQHKELLTLLESDKNNFQLLSKSFYDNKTKAISYTTSSLNQWLDLIDSTASSITDKSYRDILLSNKKWIISDRDDVLATITKNYDDGIRVYLYNSQKQEKIKDIELLEDKSKKCISMSDKDWNNDLAKKYSVCGVNAMGFKSAVESHNNYLEALDDGLKYITKVNNLSLDMTQEKVNSAQSDYTRIMDSINLSISLTKGYQTQPIATPTPSVSPSTTLKCKTEATGGLFYKTYKTTCTPEPAKTAKQLCDEQIAHWAINAQYMPDSRPTCDK